MNEIKEYLRNHPCATLEDYINYIDEETRRKRQESLEIENNRRAWYKNLTGKYFIINFNGVSFIALYIDKDMSDTQMTSYSVYNIKKYTDGGFEINKEHRAINYLWFNNPYENQPYGPRGSVYEVTKEEFEKFEEIYKRMKIDFNDVVKVLNL